MISLNILPAQKRIEPREILGYFLIDFALSYNQVLIKKRENHICVVFFFLNVYHINGRVTLQGPK